MKTKLLALLLLLPFLSIGQQYKLITATENNITIDIQVPPFQTQTVSTPQGEAFIVKAPKAMNRAEAGEPDLPMFVIPTIIGDDAMMQIRVVSSEYTDYENMEIAPSKGDFPRSINPEDVPYTYGEAYQRNAFFPSQQAQLDEPYIHRDVRGQNIILNPYSYNPITKVLRVYTHLVVSMIQTGKDDRNVIANRSNSFILDPEFNATYEQRYINYKESMAKYNAIEENGELLIICHDAFMTAMEPFVAWKKQIGRPTTIVGTSTAGNTSAAIKSYLENYYSSHPNLTDILLVGDVAQIPGSYVSAGSGYSGYSGYGDLPYGQMVGNDSYNEVLVGRFCCETEAQVTNHVNKVLNYERDLDENATWLTVGQGVSTTAGTGGHFNEDDYQHIDNIRTDLMNYNYTNVYRDYQNVSGTTASNAAAVSQHINQGVSIINYCNHGSETSWGVFNYSNSNVNALTNDYKLPYIISVACLNGKYDHNGGCFAEAWMRATNNSNGSPTGAIGGMFSYISQPWVPPMYGQDEMIDILVESYTNNIRRTMGGVSVNGNMKVLDQGATQNANKGTYNCWILFGDPTLTLRNAVPAVMSISAPAQITTTATSLSLTATNADGALATLTFNGEIMGSATIQNGTATIGFTAPGQTGQATLTVFGYNKKTNISTINIGSGGGTNPITMNVTAAAPIIAQGANTQLNANASGGNGTFSYSWTPAASLSNPNIANPTANPTTTTTYTCTVTSAGQTQSGSCTVTVVCPPTNLTATVNGQNVQLQWTAPTSATTYKVYRNNTMIAQNITSTSYTDNNLANGTYSYTVTTTYQGVTSPNSNVANATVNVTLNVSATANPTLIPLGESATLSASVTGGSGTITYSWSPTESLSNPSVMSPTATPTETTVYTVTVTRNGLTGTAQVTVQVVTPPANLTAIVENDTDIVLNWDAANLATSYTVYLNNDETYEGITGTSFTLTDNEPGTYNFEVAAQYQGVTSPRSNTATVTIEDPTCPAPDNFTGEYYWIDQEFGARLAWDKAEYQYTLDRFEVYRSTDGGNFKLVNRIVNTPSITHYECTDVLEETGDFIYRIIAFYQNDCQSDPEDVEITVTSLGETTSSISLYPNPTSGIVNVKAENIRQITVINALGQVLLHSEVDADETIIDLSSFGNGMVLVNITTDQGTIVKKLNVLK